MSRSRRVLVAVALSVVGAVLGVAGAGHAYLRAWRRALAWFALAVGVGLVLVAVFADPTTATPTNLPPEVLWPLAALFALCTLDAFVLARRQVDGHADGPTCPHCRKPVDPELDFCPWCTEYLEWPEDPRTGATATSR